MAKKDTPTGVKVISVLYYIGAALYAILGLLFIFASNFIGQILNSASPLMKLGIGLLVFVGIILVALAVLQFFIGKALMERKTWARTTTIILSGLGVLFALVSLFKGDFASIITIGINAWIGYYLWKDKDAIKAFA